MSADERRIVNPRPPVILALGITAGVFLALTMGRTVVIIATMATVAISVINALTVRKTAVFLFALAFLLGTARASFEYPTLPPEGEHSVSGTVTGVPDEYENCVVYTLRNVSVDGGRVSGKLRITVYGGAVKTTHGDRLTAVAVIRIPNNAQNDGEFNRRMYLLTEGVTATATAGYAAVTHGRGGIMGAAVAVRLWIENRLDLLYPQSAPLIKGILMGDTSDIDDETLARYRSTGMAHILALSGLHIAIITGFMTSLMRGIRPKIKYSVILAFLTAYLFVTGFPVSLIRASIMSAMLFVGRLIGRRYDAPSALGTAACIILIIMPYSLFAASFVLSFAACIGMVLIGPRLMSALKTVPRQASALLTTPISATFGTLPFSAYYFGRIGAASILGNITLIPLMYILLIPALPLTALHPLLPRTMETIAGFIDIAGSAMDYWLMKLDAIPFLSTNVAEPCIWVLMLILALYFIASPYLMVKKRVRLALMLGCISLIALVAVADRPKGAAVVLAADSGAAVVLHTDAGDFAALCGTDGAELADYARSHGLDGYDCILCASAADVRLAATLYPEAAISPYTLESAAAASRSGEESAEAPSATATDGGIAFMCGTTEIVTDDETVYIGGHMFSLFETGQLTVQNRGRKTVVTTYMGDRYVLE